ncbi:restriction endonuclease subunit S [Paenibacillus sp. N3/727]|uniref:restriction endonuclease subunit S n=1 Tax=Paenibacillus sp. N3/727 TaxID=2925845 RepID=UPI001F53DBB3|nr:restriction endonuclease subunit S [Paenibacillus sp. N3/727]UNK19360.1 restriction endonuclease subunit S [Paenibacillus sp. N3/727]
MNAPKLRFNDGWKHYKLKDIVERIANIVEVVPEQKYTQIGIRSHGKGIFIKEEVTGRELGNKRVFWIEPDCFIVNIVFAWERAVARTTSELDGLIASHRFPMYKVNNSKADLEYFTRLFLTKKGQTLLESASPGGAGRNKTLGQKEFFNIEVALPTLESQKYISSFLKKIETKLHLHQEKIDLLKEQKKGYIQKVFSQELRFKNENGDNFPEWKTNIKADELFESVSNKNHNGDYPVLSATQESGMVYRDSLERHMSFNDNNLKSYKLVEEDDFIISLRSFQGGIEISTLQGLVSPAYTVFRKKNDSVYNLYFAKVFKTDNFISRLNSTTYGIRDGKAISYKDFSTLKFDVPSIEEQKKVAQFLDLQDRKISIEEKKLRELQNQKQAFMQQIFI